MQSAFSIWVGLSMAAAVASATASLGCEAGAGEARQPPVLRIASPARGLFRDHAGSLRVTGTALPSAGGDPVDRVAVNGVPAALHSDGTFEAAIELPEGATLIQTVARDARGNTASDTRAVEAGPLHPVGSRIPGALSAVISAEAFAKISGAAGPILEGLDLAALLAPLQPIVHISDPSGEDCGFARLYIDDLTFSAARIALEPVSGGLALRVELDGVAVPGRARYAVLCLADSNTVRVTADRIAVSGTLVVTPSGAAGFATRLTNPAVSIAKLHIDASGVPGDILDALHLDSAIQFVAARAAELAIGPLVNQALGALAGPQQLDVLGHTLALQVAPSAVAFDRSGAAVALDLTARLGGSEASPGFIYTANAAPAFDPASVAATGPADGFQLGIADDLVNELLAELQASGALELDVPVAAGSFDGARVHMTLPPMLSASAGDGALHLVLGDLLATFTRAGAPVGKAAINATVGLAIAPALNGYGVALELGTPEIHVDLLDDIANATGLTDPGLAGASAAVLNAQIASISKLLVAIPLPVVAGLQMRNLSIGGGDGYVVVNGRFE
jgi:hypothetical protein